MKHIVRRLFSLWQHDKAEEWLNEMSAKGLQLVDVSFGKYTFVDGGHNEYTYRLNFMNYYNRRESAAYIELAEDMGIEYIGTVGWWGYFRKKSADEPFVLYSDNTSKIKHYTRMQNVIIFLGFIVIANLFNAVILFLKLKDISGIISLSIGLFTVVITVVGFLNVNKRISKLKKDSNISD